jgi:hypothetical protein
MSALTQGRLFSVLVAAGMPTIFARYMIDCARNVEETAQTLMQSVFVSYGRPDEKFAKRLRDRLRDSNIRTWFYLDDAEMGGPHRSILRRAINEHERVLVVCSRASLTRKGVVDELKKTLARETREGRDDILLPITLDNYIYSEWDAEEDVLQPIHDRVIGDFRGADSDDTVFEAQFPKLLTALRRPGKRPEREDW